MLSFVQRNFGFSSLNPNVDRAYDYANAFDFTQRPLQAPAMRTQPISPAEERRLDRLLLTWKDDPT